MERFIGIVGSEIAASPAARRNDSSSTGDSDFWERKGFVCNGLWLFLFEIGLFCLID